MNFTIKILIQFLFFLNLTYSQDSFKTAIAEFSTIDFPVESVSIEIDGQVIQRAQDEIGYYLTIVAPLDDNEISLLTVDQIPDYYGGVIDGILTAADAKLISQKTFTINGIEGIEIEYKSSSNPDLPSLRFARILYANQHLIKISFWPFEDLSSSSEKIKNQFFDSLTLNSDDFNNVQKKNTNVNHSENTANKIGRFVGESLAYLVIIGLIIGFIFFLIFILRKLKKKTNEINSIQKPPQNEKTNAVCYRCNTENKSDAKYCERCGYSLPKD